MSLKAKVQGSIRKLFKRLDSFMTDATYVSVSTGVFDVSTGTTLKTTTTSTVEGLKLNYQEYVGKDSVGESGDIAFISLSSNFTTTPTIKDTITLSGQKYGIVSIEPDVADVTYTFQLRITQ